MSSLPAIPAYPDDLEDDDAHGAVVAQAYMATIRNAILNHPRSLQKRIGPSEIGNTCARRIGYRLLDTPECNHEADVPWLPTVGTGGHMWADETFTNANHGLDDPIWLTEMKVSVGEIGGVEITGHSDLFHRPTGTVIDHKFVGPTTLKKYKAKGPGNEYRTQAHLYGRGFARRGLRVRRVMIAFLPRNSELRDAYLWSEPYDEQVALDGLQRAEGIHLTLDALGTQGLTVLPTADAYCTRCPWFSRTAANQQDASTSCPGHPSGDQERRADSVLALI